MNGAPEQAMPRLTLILSGSDTILVLLTHLKKNILLNICMLSFKYFYLKLTYTTIQSQVTDARVKEEVFFHEFLTII